MEVKLHCTQLQTKIKKTLQVVLAKKPLESLVVSVACEGM